MIDVTRQYVNMKDVYAETKGTDVYLEVDGTELVIRIPYLSGDATDIKELVEAIER